MAIDQRRHNALRETLVADEVALGVADTTYSPTLVELYGDLGLDFVWIDLEHGGPSPWDGEALAGLLRAAEVTGTELLVRLPTSEPAGVRKALDVGARNVFLSRVETADEVREAVRAGRYRHPEGGQRGLATTRSRRQGLAENYVATEDEEVLVGATIETEAAVESIEEICAIDDLGFVFAGPVDLSVALGHPGELDHPEVEAGIERVRSAAVDADVPLAGLGFGMDDVNEKAEDGYRLLNLGTTSGVVTAAVREWLDAYEPPT